MHSNPLAISLITYNRPDAFLRVVHSIEQFVYYEKRLITWVIGDDGSDSPYVSDWAATHPHLNTVLLKHHRLGMPGNWNRTLAEAHSYADYVLACQDDWLFTCPVDLHLAIAFLEDNPEYGMVRYHKLGGHVGLVGVIKQWNTHHRWQGKYSDTPFDYDPALVTFWELLPPFGDSNTYSPYSGGVHLRTKRFTQFYGDYPEGEKFSLAEMEHFRRVNTSLRENLNIAPRVAMFPYFVLSRFQDISGGSYRDTSIESETLYVEKNQSA